MEGGAVRARRMEGSSGPTSLVDSLVGDCAAASEKYNVLQEKVRELSGRLVSQRALLMASTLSLCRYLGIDYKNLCDAYAIIVARGKETDVAAELCRWRGCTDTILFRELFREAVAMRTELNIISRELTLQTAFALQAGAELACARVRTRNVMRIVKRPHEEEEPAS